MSPDVTPYTDPSAARALTEKLALGLHSLLPDSATTIEYTVVATAPTSLDFATAFSADGTQQPLSVPDHVTDVAIALRSAMYRPSAGTWFTAHLAVTRAGALDAHFDYDNQPRWDAPVSSSAYIRDLEVFPRAEAAIPPWLRRRLDA